MHPLAMMSEGISDKSIWGHEGQDSFVLKWAHMRAYGCSGGGRSLCTSLYMTVITHLVSPTLILKGSISVGIASSLD